jgi:hypothetical protein
MKDMERDIDGATSTPAERQVMEREMEKAMAKDIYKRSSASTTKNEMKRMARKGTR